MKKKKRWLCRRNPTKQPWKKQSDAAMEQDAMTKTEDSTMKDDAMAKHGSYITLADYTKDPNAYVDSKKVYFSTRAGALFVRV